MSTPSPEIFSPEPDDNEQAVGSLLNVPPSVMPYRKRRPGASGPVVMYDENGNPLSSGQKFYQESWRRGMQFLGNTATARVFRAYENTKPGTVANQILNRMDDLPALPLFEKEPLEYPERVEQILARARAAEAADGQHALAVKAAKDLAYLSLEVIDGVWEYGVARPLATQAFLFANILDSDESKKLSLRDTWNRTAEVSFGMALQDVRAEMFAGVNNFFSEGLGWSQPFPGAEKHDVDLWSDEDIQRAREELGYYDWVTGAGDFALNLLPIPVGKGSQALARNMGLTRHVSRGKGQVGLDDYEARLNDGVLYRGYDIEAGVTRADRIANEGPSGPIEPSGLKDFETGDSVSRGDVYVRDTEDINALQKAIDDGVFPEEEVPIVKQEIEALKNRRDKEGVSPGDQFETPLPDEAASVVDEATPTPRGSKDSRWGQNVSSDHLINLFFNSPTVADIMKNPLVDGMRGVSKTRVAKAVLEAPTLAAARDVILAHSGYVKAMHRLTAESPGLAALVSGFDDVLRKIPEGSDVAFNDRIHGVFLDSMTDFELALYNSLFVDNAWVAQSGLRGAPTARMGMASNNPVLDNVLAATRVVARATEFGSARRAQLRAGAMSGDFRAAQTKVGFKDKYDENGNMYQEAILGTRYGFTTHLLNFHPVVNGVVQRFGRLPINVINFTRVRPDEVMEEFYAMVGDSPALESGQTVMVNGKEMTSQQWTDMRSREIATAHGQGPEALRQKFVEIQIEMAYQIGARRGLSEEAVDSFYEGYMNAGQGMVEQLQKYGSYYDSVTQKRIAFDPKTIRTITQGQLALPLKDFDRYMRSEMGEKVTREKGAEGQRKMIVRKLEQGRSVAEEAFNIGAYAFRINMLLKPGYIGRNAFLEPVATAAVAMMDAAALMYSKEVAMSILKGVEINAYHRPLNTILSMVNPVKRGRLNSALLRYLQTLKIKNNIMSEIHFADELAPSQRDIVRADATADLAASNSLLRGVLESISDIEPRVAEEIAAIKDYDDFAHLARQVRQTLDGSDEPIKEIAEEINSLEKLLFDPDFTLGTFDPAFLDKLYYRQEVILAVREARQSLRTPGQIQTSPAGKQMTPGTMKDMYRGNSDMVQVDGVGGINQNILNKVIAFLKAFDEEGNIVYDGAEEVTRVLERLSKADADIEKALLELNGEQSRVAKIKADREARVLQMKEMRAGEQEGKELVLANGQTFEVDGPFAGPVGDAHRAESSGRQTRRQDFGLAGGEGVLYTLRARELSRQQGAPIGPTHPNYFDDLHYEAVYHYAEARHAGPAFRPLEMDEAGRDVRAVEMVKSIMPDRSYREALGLRNRKQVEQHVKEMIDIIDDLFPTQEAKDLIASGKKFGPAQLQEALMSDPNVVLKPIDGNARIRSNEKVYAKARSSFLAFLDKVWNSIIVTPEAKLARWPAYDREWRASLENNLNLMSEASPDGRVTMKQYEAARTIAHREALQETEKTFYTIHRYNRSVFNSRFLQTFPGAWANGLYRYATYIPKRRPAGTITAALIAKDTLDSFIVGADGEQASYWDEDARIMMPAPPGVGFKDMKGDTKFSVPANSYTRVFLDVPIGRSWLVAFGVDTLITEAPKVLRNIGAESAADFIQEFPETTKEAFDAAMPGLYDELVAPALFGDFGMTQPFIFDGDSPVERVAGTALGSVTGGHFKSLYAWLRGEGTRTWDQVANYQLQKVFSEMEKSGEYRDIDYQKEVAEPTKNWWLQRFFQQIMNVAYGAVPAASYPGNLERQEWYRIRDENPDLEYEDQLALLQRSFPDVDPLSLIPYTQSTSENPYNIPPTMDAYKEIEMFPEVARHIVNSTDDPEMVGLLALGKDDTWTESSKKIYHIMKTDKPYSGAPSTYRTTANPQKYMVNMQISNGWDAWNKITDLLDIEESNARAMGKKDQVQGIVYTRWLLLNSNEPGSMAHDHPAWWKKYKDPQVAAGRRDRTSAVILNDILGNKEVREHKEKSKEWPAWELLEDFLLDRQDVQKWMRVPGRTQEEKDIQNAIMYDHYSEKMTDYPMTKDLWDNLFIDEYLTSAVAGVVEAE